MKINKKRKGFTLAEILIIVAIIAILVSTIMISLINGRNRAQDNSAFTSFKSLAAPAFVCINSNTPGVRLAEPPNPYVFDVNICSNSAITADSTWPNFSKYAWNEFHWCNINTPIGTRPGTGPYDGINYGGNDAFGKFCFMLNKGTDKAMWCTVEGCRKEGF